MLQRIYQIIRFVLPVFVAAVFLDSLRFKFTDAPETQEIFGRLDAWAASLGAPGLFDHTGLFSQYVIGAAELIASALILAGLIPALRRLQGVGALIGICVMTGAISFHLFTPLGIDPNNDGGGLFYAAIGVWFSCGALLYMNRAQLLSVGGGILSAFREERG